MLDLYKVIEDAIRGHVTKLRLSDCNKDDVHRAVRNVMRQNPDIFWFAHQWKYSEENSTVNFRYTIDSKRSAKIILQIEDIVKNDFKLDYARSLSAEQQVMYVYKWVAIYCNYNGDKIQDRMIEIIEEDKIEIPGGFIIEWATIKGLMK